MDAVVCRFTFAALVAAFAIGACGLDPKYPPTATAVYCTSAVEDCDEQSRERCPAGYHTLDKESYTPRPWHHRHGEQFHLIRHDKVVIECNAPTQESPSS
jgi:hypothetical protein